MMAMNLQTSFLTPPFGFALFYLRGVAPPSVRTMHIYKGIIPFVIIQVIALSLLATFPRIATWLPAVVYGDGTSISRPVESDTDDTLGDLDQRRDAPTDEEREDAEFNKLFDDDESSESDRQDAIDKLFDDEEPSESDRQDAIDKLFEDERQSDDEAQKEIDDLFEDDD